ncbi:hypothetical protein Slin15195_G080040 [Septoria linicola]|uniref:Uncharacterized protein n=1 Tax=Septoria linicola TaxID=215465 RepID=A0A9Q9AY71_9PEZI|nr:hypothetical protein Slin15195_G080040 [Septoria linicola]
MMFYAVNTFQCNPYPRSLSGPRFEDVLGPWRKQIGEEKWHLVKQEGEVVLWHAFSDGYVIGSWTPEFRKIVCGMWDYAVETLGVVDGLRRVRLEIVLPKQMHVETQVVELGKLEESWERVLGELDEKLADQTVVSWTWRKGIGEQLRSARQYMLAQRGSLDLETEARSEKE